MGSSCCRQGDEDPGDTEPLSRGEETPTNQGTVRRRALSHPVQHPPQVCVKEATTVTGSLTSPMCYIGHYGMRHGWFG